MARIHTLRAEQPAKFGFKKARRGAGAAVNDAQLDLFNAASAGRIVSLPSRLSPFEEALLLDERGSDAAETAYLRAIERDDSTADAHCNLGIIYYHRGEIERALGCFTSSLAVDPRHFEAHFNLANLFFDRGEFEAAVVQYGIAESIDAGYANLYFNLGLVQALLGRYESAYRSLNAYRAMAPDADGRIADPLLDSLREVLSVAS